MRVFLFKIFLTVLFVGGIFLISISLISPKKVDDFYIKFTSPKSKSLAVGSSRCLQGFVPDEWGREIFNFGFTMANSPYGPLYKEAIEQKIIPDVSGELILEVNPVTISYYYKVNPNEDETIFKETRNHLNDIVCFNSEPNIEYLFGKYKGPLIKLWQKNENSRNIVHKNGWLEVDVDRETLESLRADKVKNGVLDYEKAFLGMKISKKRISSLEAIIGRYKSTKDIYLVRFPISNEMLALEDEYAPEFDSIMMDISLTMNVKYLDWSNRGDEFVTNDNHHLNREYARLFTMSLYDTIEEKKRQ